MPSRTAFHAFFALLATLLLSGGVHAQAFRTYLSSTGTDGPSCSRPAPCRLLPAALAAVADGGEVWILDSANYNTAPVSITKSVTILAVPGALGSVVATAGNAINVNAANAKVTLRNLVVVPLPDTGAVNGVVVTSGALLSIEKSSISNLPGHGVLVIGATRVRITDTVVRDNGDVGVWLIRGVRATITRSTVSGNASAGIFLIGDDVDTLTTADIATSTIDGNANGVAAWSERPTATLKVSVRDSRLVGNLDAGARAFSQQLGGPVSLAMSANVVANNAVGIEASGAGARVFAAGNAVSSNPIAFKNVSALFESAANNALRHNGMDNSGPVTTVTPW